MDFIKTLEKEHNEIREIFIAIDAARDLGKKKVLIKELMLVITPHLEKEDARLYPALVQSEDEAVRRMSEIFSLTMTGYARKFSDVVDKIISTDGALSTEVKVEYENVRDRITDRITVEEVTIFPAYEKIMS